MMEMGEDTSPNDHHHRSRSKGEQSAAATWRTRSQAAPEWTEREMQTLASEVAAVEEECTTVLSSYQKWKIVGDNCAALDVPRSSAQCRRMWDSMLSHFTSIRAWEESHSNASSYWSLDAETRKDLELPASFDRYLFDTIARVPMAQQEEDQGHADRPIDVVHSESEGGLGDADPDDDIAVIRSGPKRARQRKKKRTCEDDEKKVIQEIAGKLQENAQHIHAILSGGELQPEEDAGGKNTEARRRQADELIKAWECLVGGLDQFTRLLVNN